MKISIVIPCYNEEKYILSLLKSIFKNFENLVFEIIIVDDCSTDNSQDIINDAAKDLKKALASQEFFVYVLSHRFLVRLRGLNSAQARFWRRG